MNLELEGKVALVTGSSRGIGWAIAKVLADEGCRLALNGREPHSLAKAKATLGEPAMAFAADVTRPDQAAALVEAVIKHHGKLDIVVTNVGSGKSVPPGNECFDEWQRVFALNLWSATNVVEAAKLALAKSRGSVICVSSICGSGVIPDAPVTYSTAKAALNAYVRSVSRPLGKCGVRINAIAPGNIIFEGSTWDEKLRDNPEKVRSMLEVEVPLGRLGEPEEVAHLVAYMASTRSSFVSGTVWSIDGGQLR